MGERYQIGNGRIQAAVERHGAELVSLRREGKELMWQADPAFWGRTSPVLFPVVGCYWKKTSYYKGKAYQMGQHGLARDLDFTLETQGEEELWFRLQDTEETRERYPFPFVLKIGYRLEGEALRVLWQVENPGDEEMHFSIGGHPAFVCELGRSFLTFSRKGEAVSGPLISGIIEGDGSGCLSDRKKEIALPEGRLLLTPELFGEDALILEGGQADRVTLLDGEGREVLAVSFDAPLFGLWSPVGKSAPFVCIEPWYGRCDRVGFSGELTEREYGNALAPGETFAVSYQIEIR